MQVDRPTAAGRAQLASTKANVLIDTLTGAGVAKADDPTTDYVSVWPRTDTTARHHRLLGVELGHRRRPRPVQGRRHHRRRRRGGRRRHPRRRRVVLDRRPDAASTPRPAQLAVAAGQGASRPAGQGGGRRRSAPSVGGDRRPRTCPIPRCAPAPRRSPGCGRLDADRARHAGGHGPREGRLRARPWRRRVVERRAPGPHEAARASLAGRDGQPDAGQARRSRQRQGARRTTPARLGRSSASTPRASCSPASGSSTCSTPARSRSSTCWPATVPTPPASRSVRTPTASSPAGARSTAARCSCSARTSPSSAGPSARCSPRRSTS